MENENRDCSTSVVIVALGAIKYVCGRGQTEKIPGQSLSRSEAVLQLITLLCTADILRCVLSEKNEFMSALGAHTCLGPLAMVIMIYGLSS